MEHMEEFLRMEDHMAHMVQRHMVQLPCNMPLQLQCNMPLQLPCNMPLQLPCNMQLQLPCNMPLPPSPQRQPLCHMEHTEGSQLTVDSQLVEHTDMVDMERLEVVLCFDDRLDMPAW